MPTPNEWNPNTTTVYSSSGSAKEIPLAEYDKFIGLGWGATAPSAEAPETEIPKVEEEAKLPSPVEIPKDISTEQLEETELPGLMAQNGALEDTDIQNIQTAFGDPEWTPAPIFEQLGLTEQGIYGAVRIGNDVYTIGAGGRKETPESFEERFGTLDQSGIVGEIDFEQAKALGINIEADTLVSDISDVLPNSLTAEMTPEQKAQVGIDILAASEIKYNVEGLKKEKDTAITNLINTISGMWEKFETAKEEKEEKLEMEEKNKAISDAQTSYTKVKSVYDKYINELTHSTMTTAHIGGLQAKARSQMAVELAPLSAAIQITQGNWDRAKEMLDDFSDDWKQAQEWNLQAAQMKIDMLGENLTEAQEKSRFEAQNKLDWAREDYNRILDTQDEVKKLSLMYPEANISIADDWETAYKKISPFIKNEKDFEQKIKNLELKIAEKALAKPYWKATGDEDVKIVKWTQKVEDAGLTGLPQSQVDDIFNLKSPPDWFNKSMEAQFQMSKDWTDEWTEERNKVLEVYKREEDWGEYTDTEMRKLREKGLLEASTAEKDAYLYGKKDEDNFLEEWLNQ